MKKWRIALQRSIENIRLAIVALRGSRLRTVLTMLIVAVGITALMGMLTVINAVAYSLQSELGSQQGALFQVTSWSVGIMVQNKSSRKGEDFRSISVREGADFTRLYTPYGQVGLQQWVSSLEARRGSKKSNPNTTIWGINLDFLAVNNVVVAEGRPFTQREADSEDALVLIGSGIRKALFSPLENPIGQRILLGSAAYTVIGVLAEKASSFGSDSNGHIYVPMRSGLATFAVARQDVRISVAPHPGITTDHAKDMAEVIMRRVRHLHPNQRSNFNILMNDELVGVILSSMASIAGAAVLIGLITLLGSAVALMNIMFASVTERTREIGIRKAIGAYAATIRQQFLIEAVAITCIGGLIGVVLGVLVGRIVAGLMNMTFTIPWLWALGALLLSMVVGVLAGYLPAKRAAVFDPIIALRYE